MPLARLMSKLSKRDSANSKGLNDSGAAEMDCDRSPSYAVTAETLSQQQGQRSGSLCRSSLSSASSAEAVQDMSSCSPAERQLKSHTAPPASSNSHLMRSVQSVSGTSAAAAAGAVSRTASLRVMRAKGKAALRGQTLGSDEQHDSLDRSMSIEQQQSLGAFAVGSLGSAHSVPHQRAAADPVSLWVATGSITNSQKLPQLLAASGIIPADDDEDDEPLASPLSPGAGHAADADPHCEWEDGVVAGWLDAMDPSELMHDDGELCHSKQQQPRVQQQKQQQLEQQRSSGVSRAKRSGSTASATMAAPEVVFGSLLYS
ncbi:hypothetical protein OEZ86_011719 [Tetradesmus obliquus]|nr:hypothetical protein OEZ86_011719 [Tetradesmus obliquus]